MKARRLMALGVLAATLAPRAARAEDLAVPGGLTVSVRAEERALWLTRPGAPRLRVPIEGGAPREGAKARVVPIGLGRSVVHVVVPLEQGRWEAVLEPSLDAPIFAGRTGYLRGTEGEREGARVELLERPGGTHAVVVADLREDATLCGADETPLRPRGLDPKTLTLRGATLQRLSPKARAEAKPVDARVLAAAPAPPVARLLALGGESGGGGAKHLLDGAADTAWYEDRPGVGQGEFVTLRAPREVAVPRLVIALAPPGPDVVAPRTLYLVTPREVLEVRVPEGARPGATLEVGLPTPLRSECLSIVLGDAYADGVRAPRVGLARIDAYAALEARPLAEVARELGEAGARADEALAYLKRAGAEGLAALEAAYAGLGAAGRARAIDVATSAPSCDAAAGLLLRGMTDADREAARRARDRLERCGRGAAGALGRGLASDDPRLRTAVAGLFGVVAPREAMAALPGALGRGDGVERAAVRGGLAKAARGAEPEALDRLLAGEASAARRVELVRALAARLGELAGAEGALTAALTGADMAARFVLVEPARALARAGKPRALLALLDDPDAHVRARSAEAAAGVDAAAPALRARVGDPAPRVREAALGALAAAKGGYEAEASAALAGDEWTFVRAAAARALGAARGGPDDASARALARALGDRSVPVRRAVLAALGERRATPQAGAIAAVASDAEAPLELRVMATRALGAVCARGELELLTRAARRAIAPVDEADLQIGVAAIDALGRVHPPDLAARLEPLRDKRVRPPLRHAAERALAEPDTCRAQ